MLLQFVSSFAELILELQTAGDFLRILQQRQIVRPLSTGKNTVERIVITLRNGIVFVVVTAGAGDSQAEKAPRCGIDLIIDLVVRIIVEEPSEGWKAEGGKPP